MNETCLHALSGRNRENVAAEPSCRPCVESQSRMVHAPGRAIPYRPHEIRPQVVSESDHASPPRVHGARARVPRGRTGACDPVLGTGGVSPLDARAIENVTEAAFLRSLLPQPIPWVLILVIVAVVAVLGIVGAAA